MYKVNEILIDPVGNTEFQINDWEQEIPPTTLITKAMMMDYYQFLPPQLARAGLWGWGVNTNGGLGNNNRTASSSPIQTMSGGFRWKSVSVGTLFTGAIKTDGTLWMWGFNTQGQLGDNTVAAKSSPVQTIAGGTNWSSIDAGQTNVAGIKTDGTLWLWGLNTNGQLGDNTVAHKSSPVQTVAGGTNWKQVSCGFYAAAAVKTDGTLWLWGLNSYGQLGDNTLVTKSSPVQTASGGTNWKQAAMTNKFVAAIKTDGTLWTWGININGQLGNNTTNPTSVAQSPAQTVSGGTNWRWVDVSDTHTVALKTDGTLWTWGYNASGQLGDNTVTQRQSPGQTIVGGTDWKAVACGPNTTYGIVEFNANYL